MTSIKQRLIDAFKHCKLSQAEAELAAANNPSINHQSGSNWAQQNDLRDLLTPMTRGKFND